MAVCTELTGLLDRCLAAMFASVAAGGAALVAVGGYGRGEMCLHSDVDVMVLHRGGDLQALTQGVLYPLWDAKLAVGHAVRTVREAITAAEEKVETLCSLLSSRLVAGEAALVAELEAGLAGLLTGGRRGLGRVLAAEERERRAAEPYHLLSADLKFGRGGLRTLQAIGWDRRREELVGGTPSGPGEQELAARDRLLAVRNGLHAAVGKASDRYVPDLRAGVAAWLGSDQVTVGRQLYTAMRTIEALADERWPELAAEAPHDPVAITGRWVLRAFRSLGRSPRPDDVAGPLHLAGQLVADPARRLTADEQRAVAAAGPPEWTAAERAALVRMLAAGRPGQRAFEQLARLGWIERALPEWGHVVAAPQVAPLHLHPVDTHLWRTVHELLEVTGSDSDEPLCEAVAEDLGSLDDALLAAFFHDIGKGRPGDHSVVGAELAGTAAQRMGLGDSSATLLRTVVRHHLLLPQVATRRDLADPEVIADLAVQAGDAHTLRMLYLVAVADARATGPAVWNSWKSSLVRSAFLRALDAVAGAVPGEEAAAAEAGRAVVELSGGRLDDVEVRRHVAGMPAGYVLRFEPAEILRHVELARPRPDPAEVRLDVVAAGPVASVVVVTADRPGALALVSGVLALHNVAVLDARVTTRADGVAIDSFYVADVLGAEEVPPARWDRVRADLARVAEGAYDLEAALADKLGTYPPSGGEATVTVHGEGERAIVEVRCGDRVGLLHDLSRALFDLGASIDIARVDTRGDRVTDVFYVRSPDQRHPGWQRRVEESLTAVARS